jgi:hypothetical protein
MSDHEELPGEVKNPFEEAEEPQVIKKKRASVISLKPDDLC